MPLLSPLDDGAALATAAVIAATTLAVAAVVVQRLRRARDPATEGQEPLPPPAFPPEAPPGGGAPLFHGVRVVEVSTIIAAPSAARFFADLGAQVVKVEGPGGPGRGEDPLRSALVQFAGRERAARGVSPVFEAQNVGKLSVCLDLAREEGRAALVDVLRDADVLITNVRMHQLERLGLDYATLSARLPHLVVGHVSAWGIKGPDRELPGFDVTAFLCATGMAHLFHSPTNWMYHAYPLAFGDAATGLGLVAGVAVALADRTRNGGRGALVSNALYRAGVFCTAPHILGPRGGPTRAGEEQTPENREKDGVEDAEARSPAFGGSAVRPTTRILEHGVQDYRRASQSDGCSAAEADAAEADAAEADAAEADAAEADAAEADAAEADAESPGGAAGRSGGELPRVAPPERAVRRALHAVYAGGAGAGLLPFFFSLSAPPHDAARAGRALAEALGLDAPPTRAALAARFERMSHGAVEAAAAAAGVPVCFKADSAVPPTEQTALRACFEPIRGGGVPDCARGVPRAPCDFSCSDAHGAGRRAATKGAHTQAFLERRWGPRPQPRPGLQPQPRLAGGDSAKPRNREIVVFELSEARSSSAAAATKQFAASLRGSPGTTVRVVLLEPRDEPEAHNGAYWRAENPAFEDFLNAGKERPALRTLRDAARAVAASGRSDAGMKRDVFFVSNVKESALARAGLDHAALSAAVPDIVSVVVTPFGLGQREDARGDLAAWYIAGGASEWFSGHRSEPPEMPAQVGELIVSFSALACLGAAHFHRLRTGEGQRAAAAMSATAVWGVLYQLNFRCGKPGRWARRNGRTRHTPGRGPLRGWAWARLDMPSFSSMTTRDGQRVLLAIKSLPNFLGALAAIGCRGRVLARTAWNVVREKVESVAGGHGDFDLLEAILAGFASANEPLRAYVAGMTLEAFRADVGRTALAWTPVLTPDAVPRSVQAAAAGAIAVTDRTGARVPAELFQGDAEAAARAAERCVGFEILCPVQRE
jgi:crotonobetainyl-CoA:carnitine CoA-transferase CaiB-like acyl-CoA transferase